MKKLSRDDINSGKALAIAFFEGGLVMGPSRLSSLLFVSAISRYDVDRKRASFPFVLCFTVRNLVGPLVGYATKTFGLRAVITSGSLLSAVGIGSCYFAEDITTVTLLWGVLYGIGLGFGTLANPYYLSLYFSKHLDKANGIVFASDSVAYLLYSLLTEYALITYGLSGTYLFISAVMLHSVPIAFFVKTPTKTKTTKLDSSTETLPNDPGKVNTSHESACSATVQEEQDTSTVNAFRVFLDATYILVVIVLTGTMYLYSLTYTILIDVARDHGVSADDEVYLFLAVSVAEFFGRVFLGIITDAGYLSRLNFCAVCFAGMGLLYAACVWIKGFAMMMTFCSFAGLFMGGLLIVSAGLVTFYTDKEYHSVGVPSRLILYAAVSFTQAPLIGLFRDTLQSYDGLFYVLIGICCVSAITCLFIPHFIVWKKKRSQQSFSTNGPDAVAVNRWRTTSLDIVDYLKQTK